MPTGTVSRFQAYAERDAIGRQGERGGVLDPPFVSHLPAREGTACRRFVLSRPGDGGRHIKPTRGVEQVEGWKDGRYARAKEPRRAGGPAAHGPASILIIHAGPANQLRPVGPAVAPRRSPQARDHTGRRGGPAYGRSPSGPGGLAALLVRTRGRRPYTAGRERGRSVAENRGASSIAAGASRVPVNLSPANSPGHPPRLREHPQGRNAHDGQVAIGVAGVTFSSECGIQTIMDAGLTLVLMLIAFAFARPDAAIGVIIGYLAILLARRL